MLKQVSIIGAGRVGQALAGIGRKKEVEAALLRRGQHNLLSTGPIVVCTRNDDLRDVLDWIPNDRRSDLIFIQNGMLQTWFAEVGLQEITQGLLYIAVSKAGDTPVDGGRSVVTGPHAQSFVTLMNGLGLQCREVTRSEYVLEMLEKLLWNCVFGLLCQVHDTTVGEIVVHHKEAITRLTGELLAVACEDLVQPLPSEHEHIELVERLCRYSLSIEHYKGAVKEWHWRNGWFWERQQDPTCFHAALLQAANVNF